jgi:molecular chaperone HtpG
MFITDRAELLPPWLRVVIGVVDTEDLPLNVSREMLQSTPVLARIRRAVTNRVITELKTLAKGEAYRGVWENFGPVIKEGAWDDSEHRGEIAPLLRFASSTEEGLVSLPEYVARMKEGQEAIYYLAGDSIESLRGSAQLEGFRARGVEVLLMADPIDAFWPERLDSFDGKKLRSVTLAGEDMAKIAPLAAPQGEAAETDGLIEALKAALGDAVSAVRTTDRLVDSAVVLAAGGGQDLQAQRLLRRAGRMGMASAPVLEINPRHALVAALAAQVAEGSDIAASAAMLFDLARIQEGDAPRDPAGFARAVEARLAEALARG